MKILIKNAQVVNPEKTEKNDVLINNTKIEKVGKKINVKADKEIDASGKYLFPGFIDLHTHFRTPGAEEREDILSGSRAAVKGGFTTCFCMPNTDPAIDNEGIVNWLIEEARKVGLIDLYPVGTITKKREAKELSEFGALKKAGCKTLSDDGTSVKDSLLLRRAFEYAKMFDLLLVSHCEDSSLSDGGSMRESAVSSKYGIAAIPSISESLIVQRDIALAKYLDTKVHLAHISTADSVELIKRAKAQGVKVTAETCPHYFSLTLDDIVKNSFDGNFKVNPPLGDREDLKAIIKGLKEGVIDCIATDHAPHSKSEKELPFEDAPFGFIGLELAFSLVNTYLIKKGLLSVEDVAAKLAANPARIVGLKERGEVREKYLANLTIVDPDKKWTPTLENIVSKSKNTPFLNQELEGAVELTLYKGKIVYSAKI